MVKIFCMLEKESMIAESSTTLYAPTIPPTYSATCRHPVLRTPDSKSWAILYFNIFSFSYIVLQLRKKIPLLEIRFNARQTGHCQDFVPHACMSFGIRRYTPEVKTPTQTSPNNKENNTQIQIQSNDQKSKVQSHTYQIRRRRPQTIDATMMWVLLAAVLIHGAQGFYLPGVNPYSFAEGET